MRRQILFYFSCRQGQIQSLRLCQHGRDTGDFAQRQRGRWRDVLSNVSFQFIFTRVGSEIIEHVIDLAMTCKSLERTILVWCSNSHLSSRSLWDFRLCSRLPSPNMTSPQRVYEWLEGMVARRNESMDMSDRILKSYSESSECHLIRQCGISVLYGVKLPLSLLDKFERLLRSCFLYLVFILTRDEY